MNVLPVGLSPAAAALAGAAAAQVAPAFAGRGQAPPNGGDVVLARITLLLSRFAAAGGGEGSATVSEAADAELLAAGEARTHAISGRVLSAVRLRAGRAAVLLAAAKALVRNKVEGAVKEAEREVEEEGLGGGGGV